MTPVVALGVLCSFPGNCIWKLPALGRLPYAQCPSQSGCSISGSGMQKEVTGSPVKLFSPRSPFFLPLESQQHDLPRNLLKTFALGKLCQLFCDIVPASLAPNLGKHFPQTDPPSFIPENMVSQDELKVLEQTKNQLCQIVTIRSPPRLWCPCHLSDITKHSLKFKGTWIFVQWRQKPWYLRYFLWVWNFLECT